MENKTILIELSENENVVSGIVIGSSLNSVAVILNQDKKELFEEILEFINQKVKQNGK